MMHLLISLVLLSAAALSFDNTAEDPRILEIRKWYNQIRLDINNDMYEEKDGYYYQSDGTLVMVESQEDRDGFTKKEEFYFHNGELFFYYSHEVSIHERAPLPEGMTDEEAWQSGAMYNALTNNIIQVRAYYYENELIRYLTKEKILSAELSYEETFKAMLKVRNEQSAVSDVKFNNEEIKSNARYHLDEFKDKF